MRGNKRVYTGLYRFVLRNGRIGRPLFASSPPPEPMLKRPPPPGAAADPPAGASPGVGGALPVGAPKVNPPAPGAAAPGVPG